MIALSERFDYKKLIRITFPSVVMMIFTSIYIVVDGFFVSNFTGKSEFAAVNFILPFLLILGSVGFMFGTGGSALIGKALGEGDQEKANRIFSMLVYISIAVGIVLTALGMLLIRPFAAFLGASGELRENCVLYGRVYLIGIVAYILQFEFQCFLPTAQKPKLGLYITIAAGLTNIILDALLVAVFPFGLVGAAAASVAGMVVGGVIPLVYFARRNSSLLRLGKTRISLRDLGQSCLNGSSELLSNVSSSVVGMLYNSQLLKYAGEDGVAAYGVMLYVSMIFMAVFLGYSVGVAPVVSYHFGAQNHGEIKRLLRMSLIIIGLCSLGMFGAGELLATPLAKLFVGYDQGLMEMTRHGFAIYSVSFLLIGICIFGSAWFTALNNGIVSGVLSLMRALVFQIIAVMVFPLIWQTDGIWAATVFAETAAIILTSVLLIANRKKYHY